MDFEGLIRMVESVDWVLWYLVSKTRNTQTFLSGVTTGNVSAPPFFRDEVARCKRQLVNGVTG